MRKKYNSSNLKEVREIRLRPSQVQKERVKKKNINNLFNHFQICASRQRKKKVKLGPGTDISAEYFSAQMEEKYTA